MNNGSGALEDAVKATAKDPSYAKGYYRKGMSELKLNRLSDAKASFLAGVALVPDDKSFRDQLDKLNAVGANTSSPAPVSKPSAAAKPSSKPVGSASNKPATDTTEVDNEQVGGVFRGYKKTSDGRTTTFFNNELDETTKALIGDIAPKKLDAPDVPAVVPAPAAAGSVWNTAGTFEERICTPWAQSRLEELFTDMQVDALPLDSVISLTKSAFSGDAAITRNRGKVKHVYDFTATCEWKLTVMESSSVPESCCGTIVMNDITGDKDYEFEVTVDSAKKRPSHEAAGMIDSHIKRGRLQQQMVAACNTFHEEFNAKL